MADHITSRPSLRIASHNVQGINSPIKRRKIFQSYHVHKIDILFLQETHFPKTYSPSFIHSKFPRFYLANSDNKTKGVGIFFSCNIQFSFLSEFKDPEGRFLLVKGLIDEQLYSFISYYAPNRGQSKFFKTLFHTLNHLTEGLVMYGGDSNIAFDAGLDKSRPPGRDRVRPTRQSLNVARQIFHHGLVDVWREMNPHARDYTHFSSTQNTYARIDHFFLLSTHIPLVTKSVIKDSACSDHSLLHLTLNRPSGHRQGFCWRLNASILSNPTHVLEIDKGLQEYFLLTDIQNVSPITLWAAHKAFIRGKIIQIASRLRKARKADIERLEKEFSLLSKLHKCYPSPGSAGKLDTARTALNLALTALAEKSLRWQGGRFYHQKDKTGTLLAKRLTPKIQHHTLPKIKLRDGTLSQNPQKILEVFQNFYSSLYNSEGLVSSPNLHISYFTKYPQDHRPT